MLMLFFFIMPSAMSGLGNLLLPVLLATPEMAFPKVNNLGMYPSAHAPVGLLQGLYSHEPLGYQPCSC